MTKLKRSEQVLARVKAVRDEAKGKYASIKAEVKEGDVVVAGVIKKSECVPGLGGSLKYYRTAFVGKHGCDAALDEDRDELAANAGTMLALAEGTLDEVSVPKKAEGFWLHYTDGGRRHTLVYYSARAKELPSLAKETEKIRAKDNAARFSVYVYTIGGSVAGYENEFDDLTNIDLKPIPEPILDIYKSVNGD